MKQRNARTVIVRGKTGSVVDNVPEERWARLERIATLLKPTVQGSLTLSGAKELAKQLGVHWTTVYEYRRRLNNSAETTAIAGRKKGWKSKATRLLPDQEKAINEAIAALRRKRRPIRLVDVVKDVHARCRLLKVLPPSRPAIDRRLRQTTGLIVERRDEALPGDSDPRVAPGTFHVRHPLDIVQIDHTPVDLIVVDDLFRLPIGRPYLTVAMDVATRSVLSFVITFDPPSASTVSLCLTQIISPKDRWIKSLGLDVPWPMAGLPKSLHLDNAEEFKSKALRRGCAQYGIDLIYRPRGRPHFGGHIERLIGTIMHRLKTLPGATGGSTKGRKRRAPEKTACMTLSELDHWIALEIGVTYHQAPHRGLKGSTPLANWTLHDPAPFSPEAVNRFRLTFLPAVTRTLRRDGLTFSNFRYWHPIFAQWLGRCDSLVAHYDPRDISRLYVPHENSYLEVPYADLRLPSVSIWEAAAAARHLRETGRKTVNEKLLVEVIEAQRKLVLTALAKTKKVRLRHQRSNLAKSALTEPPRPTEKKSGDLDWNAKVKPYDGEIW